MKLAAVRLQLYSNYTLHKGAREVAATRRGKKLLYICTSEQDHIEGVSLTLLLQIL
jgi:hypothetical protein